MTQYMLALPPGRPSAAPVGPLSLDGRCQLARMTLLEALKDCRGQCGYSLYLARGCRGLQPGTDNFRRRAGEDRDEAFRIAREGVRP